ncbi:hypothetical protein KQX54_006745 [Cotesia glomerata]|uniref:ZSWIM3 N-terminal domain-containing protein n=1 Tax=Cotesia glomerata TaxID=32391 RepID=A0AAV7IQZ1_COTGL|nr:hypothetical protein KQX54_006745 [Cotesia glomerata]
MHSKFNETIKFKSFEKFHRRLLAFQYHTGYKFVQGSSTPLASCHSSKLKSNVELCTRLRYYFCPFSCEYGSKKNKKKTDNSCNAGFSIHLRMPVDDEPYLQIFNVRKEHNHQSVPVLFLDGTSSPDETVAEESTPTFETENQGTKNKSQRVRNLRSCRNQNSGNVSVNSSSNDDVELPPVRPGGNTGPESQKQPSAVPPAGASEELIPETCEKEPGLPSSPIDSNSQVLTEQPPAVPSAGASEELTVEICEKEPGLPSSPLDGNSQVLTEQPPSVVADNPDHSYACSSETIAITTNRRKRKNYHDSYYYYYYYY